MTTALDSNVLASLWDRDPQLSGAAQAALDAEQARGSLVISGCVFAEFLAGPGRTEDFLEEFLERTGVSGEWELEAAIWRAAGRAFHTYASCRRTQRGSAPRRILADFIIGAHAQEREYRLLTAEQRWFQSAFPDVVIVGF